MRFLLVLALLHVIAPMVAVLSDMIIGRQRHSLRKWAIIYTIYFYKTAAINLALLLSLPLLVLLLISGPGALLGFLVSVVGLGFYLVENIIGYDVKGAGFHGDDRDALLLIGLLIVSIGFMVVAWTLHSIEAMDRFPAWLGDGLKRPLHYLEKIRDE